MNTKTKFKAARSLYRHGMRIAPVFLPGDPDAPSSMNRWGRSIRPECQEALQMASRLDPSCAQFLPRIAAAPLVSTLRTLYRHNNPRMYSDNGTGRRDAGHPYTRQALRELSRGLLLSNAPILPGPTRPLKGIVQAEIDIRLRKIDIRQAMDPIAAAIFAPVFKSMGFAS